MEQSAMLSNSTGHADLTKLEPTAQATRPADIDVQ